MPTAPPSPPTFPKKELLVLELLAEHGQMFGLELVRVSHGRLKRGTVYVTLGRLADKGWVDSEQEPRHPGAIGLPRRMYRITPLGLRVLAWRQLRRAKPHRVSHTRIRAVLHGGPRGPTAQSLA